ncbi:MAG: PASTA domain-containing protein [Muribaculaceae bacterium]|nr:PASTA domain-containing protein [Muribaculaceae bacterium]
MTAGKRKKQNNNKTHILFRYGLITLLFLVFALLVVAKMFKTTVLESKEWNRRANTELSRIDTIAPERGNILASNGNILACNLKVWDIKIDLRHDKLKNLDPLPMDRIDELAEELDRRYPRPGYKRATHPDSLRKYSWKTRLRRELAKPFDRRPRALVIARKATQEDFEEIRNLPFLRDFTGSGTRNPLYKTERNIRMYPYGRMAYRSIGRVNENFETGEFHGYSGLEKDLDTLLYGKPGLAKRVTLNKGVGSWVKTPAVRGYDLLTTIDIDLQDMLEQSLSDICRESGAEWGTAILMEVATGEIKAISNVERLADGSYGEALNRAVLPFEPGSVMKPISLMIAFEDGLVKRTTDGIDCSPFQRTTDPHAPGYKTMKQVIEMSSNTGIARVIFRKYAADPAQFHDRLASIGFFEPMHSGIAGEQTPRIRRLVDKDSRGNPITMTSRHLDLARQAYGYNTEIPPLYTLSVYNAIANGGRYVRPHLLRALRSEETGLDSVLPITYIRDRICSEETARKVGECMHEVVWGEHGTARMVRDDRVKIVGKTGTAFPVEKGVYDRSKRRYAFAGYFPYEAPKYSCMALILGPGGTSANRTSGQVVKEIAVKMYARGMLDNRLPFNPGENIGKPTIAASMAGGYDEIARDLGGRGVRKVKASPAVGRKTVPDVVGYDAPSAVRIMEERGLNVSLHGTGIVVSQSLPPGTPISGRHDVRLALR